MSSNISIFNTPETQEHFLAAYKRLMKTWSLPYEDKWVETSFGRTHAIVSGPVNGEPLVLLPGAQATGAMWGPMIPDLVKNRRVFCLDLIDQVGLSEPNKVLTNSHDSSTWLKETLDGLSLDKVDIGGNSLGCFIVSMFAVSYPDRVKNLILTAPAATVSGIRLLYILKILFASWSSNPSVKSRFLEQNSAGLVDNTSTLFQLLFAAMSGSKVISKITPRQLTVDELRSIKSPVLIILGDKDMTAQKKADEVVNDLSELALNFQCEIIEGAGHLWTEQQYMFAGNKISQFLEYSQ
ncbi:hypothetical protein BIT28_10865 [Photobacterium proteolyticum]|uniref:AB hydrolase-1 domain-containing protein n=1 Tax=Photobacterium proteolyticum TaxID=1903952 RepID=A0A1Q9G6T0_9GAMM|nr:alpha/beta fold hydrolase [Photobacterium proteolyticum]OLQ70033.1 hypothetical protein BIT28_10865 [Photobacterium proteolyticum]